jgi:hypothetical protein
MSVQHTDFARPVIQGTYYKKCLPLDLIHFLIKLRKENRRSSVILLNYKEEINGIRV